jgi:hypothetical protein
VVEGLLQHGLLLRHVGMAKLCRDVRRGVDEILIEGRKESLPIDLAFQNTLVTRIDQGLGFHHGLSAWGTACVKPRRFHGSLKQVNEILYDDVRLLVEERS